MTTFIWILIAYLLSVAVTYPTLKRHTNDPKTSAYLYPFNPNFVAKFAAFIPLYNLYLMVVCLRVDRANKRFKERVEDGSFDKAADIIDGLAEKETDPHLKKKHEELAKALRNIKNEID